MPLRIVAISHDLVHPLFFFKDLLDLYGSFDVVPKLCLHLFAHLLSMFLQVVRLQVAIHGLLVLHSFHDEMLLVLRGLRR